MTIYIHPSVQLPVRHAITDIAFSYGIGVSPATLAGLRRFPDRKFYCRYFYRMEEAPVNVQQAVIVISHYLAEHDEGQIIHPKTK